MHRILSVVCTPAALVQKNHKLALRKPWTANTLPLAVIIACWAASAAHAEITKAPPPASLSQVKVETIARGLDHPWAVQELPDRRLLVTERPGRMRIVDQAGRLSRPVANVPKVASGGQGGLLDVVLAPDFAKTGIIYWSYSEPRGAGRNTTAVARARLDANSPRPSLSNVKVIFRQQPTVASSLHFGSRIVTTKAGTLFVTLGERFYASAKAQQPTNHQGKIVHITTDGRPAAGTPAKPGWLPEIWSIGHRNPQGAAIHPGTGELWTVEHGARGGDEINIPKPGRNYGWPVITYGRDYSGAKIGIGTAKPGMQQPLYYWDPSIAPSGMAFYNSSRFPAWNNSVFIGALAGQHLARLRLSGNKIVAEEQLLTDLNERIRDVRQANDGSLLVVTNSDNGRIVRVTPVSAAP